MSKDKIKYKDFIGSVHFSQQDNTFFGKIEYIDDLVTFEGKTVEELQKAFRDAVEDYLQLCEQVGKEATKSYKGILNVRITPELHKKAVYSSHILGMSISQFIQKAIEKEVSKY